MVSAEPIRTIGFLEVNRLGDLVLSEAAINRLRKKVDYGFDRPLIHTIRSVGYVLRED